MPENPRLNGDDAPRRRPGQVLGTITRGTTNPNRLRRVDRWMAHRLQAELRTREDPLIVDLGYGASGRTSSELLDRLGAAAPGVEVLGLEIDPERVRLAREEWTRPGLSFARGGFEVPRPRDPLAIRAFNVLRQYEESEVDAAWAQMTSALAPGGLLVEGTCDELGRLCAWAALPAGPAPMPETLTLSVSLEHLERPSDLAARLPKALIHRNVPGEPVHALLTQLDREWDRAAPLESLSRRQRWIQMCRALRASGTRVLDGPRRWRLGELTIPWPGTA